MLSRSRPRSSGKHGGWAEPGCWVSWWSSGDCSSISEGPAPRGSPCRASACCCFRGCSSASSSWPSDIRVQDERERIAAARHTTMDGRGRYLDNIFIERLWRSLKYEAPVRRFVRKVPSAGRQAQGKREGATARTRRAPPNDLDKAGGTLRATTLGDPCTSSVPQANRHTRISRATRHPTAREPRGSGNRTSNSPTPGRRHPM